MGHEEARIELLSDDLIHRHNEVEQVSLRGSARDKPVVLDTASKCDAGPLVLECDGFLLGCPAARMMMGCGADSAGWVVCSVLIVG